MKNLYKNIIYFIVLSLVCLQVYASDNVIVTATSDVADGLDLHAVADLFQHSETLEQFEQKINHPDTGINNLDVDNNGEVDFIRVLGEAADLTHLIVLQVDLGMNQFQDIATIEIEKVNNQDHYNIQIRGNESLYGNNYYITPATVVVTAWPVLNWIYRPHYRPYRSAYSYGRYPSWWRAFSPVSKQVYRSRTVRFAQKKTFIRTQKNRVLTVSKVKYQPRRTNINKTKKVVTKKVTTKKTATKNKGKHIKKTRTVKTTKKGTRKTNKKNKTVEQKLN